MSTDQYDVVILGSGNAGMGVTVETRKAGLSVAMVEYRELGGTCPNRGCTPKKILVAAGHALDEIERAAAHHIAVGKPRLDWAALIDREKNMISPLPDSFAELMRERGVECCMAVRHLPARTRCEWADAPSKPSTSSSPPARSRVNCRSTAPSI